MRALLWMMGTGRSYLCFFLLGCGLMARGGRQGTWFSLKKVTMKGCLERGPLRPTRPIQAADRERSERENGPRQKPDFVPRSRWFQQNPHLPRSPRRDGCPGCCGGGAASGWRLRWRQRPASPPALQEPTACPAEPAPPLWRHDIWTNERIMVLKGGSFSQTNHTINICGAGSTNYYNFIQ